MALGLGASLGDRRATLERTVRQLDLDPCVQVVAVSRWYRSAPMRGGTARGWFLNGVVRARTALSPHELLDRCIALEDAAGRRRARHWCDRPLDLDVVWIDGWTSDDPRLRVPHPGIAQRAFVYWPLHEVWPAAAQAAGPPPARHGIVPVGVFARGRRPAYPSVPSRTEPRREAVHRLGQPRPHP